MPIIVYFWAPWCGPCKQLNPVLEKLVEQDKGSWILVKINADKNKSIMAQLGIQSLPTVYLFKNGQPIDGFMGVMAEKEIRQFLDGYIERQGEPTEAADVLLQAEKFWYEGLYAQALSLLLPLSRQFPQNHAAAILLTRVLYAAGHIDKARQVYANLQTTTKDLTELDALEELFQLIEEGQQKRTSLPIDIGLKQFSEGQFAQAMDSLLEVIRSHNAHANGEAGQENARIVLLKMFSAIGIEHPVVHNYRQQLAAIIFA